MSAFAVLSSFVFLFPLFPLGGGINMRSNGTLILLLVSDANLFFEFLFCLWREDTKGSQLAGTRNRKQCTVSEPNYESRRRHVRVSFMVIETKNSL